MATHRRGMVMHGMAWHGWSTVWQYGMVGVWYGMTWHGRDM